jgi:hypothetical protein
MRVYTRAPRDAVIAVRAADLTACNSHDSKMSLTIVLHVIFEFHQQYIPVIDGKSLRVHQSS